MSGGWIGVDLDGTLAHYDGWQGETHIGEPIAPMVARVKAWIAAGTTVKIVTARVSPGINRDGTYREIGAFRKALDEWCEQHLGARLAVTHSKDFSMIELWDDRAVQVIPNTGLRADGKPG